MRVCVGGGTGLGDVRVESSLDCLSAWMQLFVTAVAICSSCVRQEQDCEDCRFVNCMHFLLICVMKIAKIASLDAICVRVEL